MSLRFYLLALAFLLATLPVAAQEEDEGWDVNAAHGPTETVAFTVTEGTWMNLDVSPDGQTIVFDLLGDLYTLPITGGQATRITSGPAFDIQPRFSPDGRHLAFTSDRAGGDNLWIARADGSDAEQVTKEDFRLLNGPAWTPDGQYLLGRKHFTSTRSLGAGEVWLYHTSGGAGLQLTERRNDQQDQGNEIAVSPDGRYVYFAEDNTGGSTFQYNKDPNSGIYAIKRLDRETGEVETLLSGPGGASRPQPSPDGRHLAFVRRVRTETVLFLYDLETGAQMPLFDGLSPDQQETWAVFGTYPGFAWTPDGESLVFWAQGGLHRLDVATRELTGIPFEVAVEQTITEAVRFPVDVAPERFQVRMMRDAATSPDGRTLVFHAVGYLWKILLPDGEITRLTDQSDHFEYDPVFSPDGRTLVYTTFNDEDYGAIRTVALDGGQSRTLTTEPGHYFTPRFSDDGGRIVFQKGGGNGLRGPLYGVETGLYWMDARGGQMNHITDSGREPRFSPDGERVFFLTGGGLSKEYKSIDVDGSDERTHFTLKYPTTVVPSPDGEWVAFTEAFNVYVAPFPRIGGDFDLNKDTRALPVTRVSRDAGTELHWVDDDTIRWLIGPEVYTRDLDDAFAFRPGAPEELPDPDSVGTMLGMTLPHDQPEGTMALVGARLITMNGDEVIEDGTIVVEGNRITAVGPRSAVSVPAGALTVDAAGHTIMPGFVDVHAHAGHFFSGPLPRANWYHYANLAYGVTTMHDPSATTETVFSLAELVKAGEVVGPRVFSTGTILYGADGDFRATVNSLDDARSHLRRMQAVGAISVKSYNQPRRDQRQQVLQAARELGMNVVPEGGSTFIHNVNMVIDGHTGIEHAMPVAPLHDDVLSLWGATEVGYTPTLVVGYGGLWGENYWYAHTNVWEDERLLTFTPRGVVDALSRRRTIAPDDEYWHITLAESAKALTDRGVRVNLGAHGQMQGLAAHWELWMFGQGGMTNHEALRAVTLNGAWYVGLDGDLGSLEAGKLADLIVLSENPLDDLRNSTSIRYVMANGRLYDSMTMNQIAPTAIERPAFWFEREGSSDAAVWQSLGLDAPHCAAEGS
ncbi:MAG: amidohydrolase family protein [Rhodothermaceae bacterium]|nr:amidohydrolase family protein [Rhodothermaceae bacterium]